LPFCKVALRAEKPVSVNYPKELKTLGNHLRKKRLDLKLLQKEVAKKLGTTPCTVRNWETNKSNPSLAFIPTIVQFLGYVPYDTSNQDFGKKIAVRRCFLGLRQKDLARLIGVDPSTIKHWEKGEHRPEKRLLKRLAALFINNQLPYRPQNSDAAGFVSRNNADLSLKD
jgi:transcriptional regulator with XRE-family HTH domain